MQHYDVTRVQVLCEQVTVGHWQVQEWAEQKTLQSKIKPLAVNVSSPKSPNFILVLKNL